MLFRSGFVVDGAMRGAFKNVPGLHLGNETTDPSSSSVAVYNRQRLVSTLNTQYGLLEQTMFSTSDTATANGVYVDSRFADGAYVTNTYHGLRITPPTPGAGHSIGSVRAILIDDMTGTGSGYGVFLGMNSATNKWALYSNGTAKSYHLGQLGIGVEPPDTNPMLFVRKTAPAASPAWQAIDTAIFQGTTSCLVQCHAGAVGGTLGFDFSVGATRNPGAIHYTTSSNTMILIAGSVAAMTLTSSLIKSQVQHQFDAGWVSNGGFEVTGNTHFVEGTATGLIANATADTIVIDSTGNLGISFLTALASTTSIMFGNSNSNNQGGFSYSNTSDILNIRVGAATRMSIGSLNIDMTLPLDITTSLSVNGTKVVGTRRTGWTAATGTATRTTFATGTVTLPVLAEHVKALIDDLIAHGLIGA